MILRMLMIGTVLALAGCGVWVDQRASRAEAVTADRWPPVGRFVEVEGVHVHYIQEGAGPDVVLIHGAGGNLRDFTFTMVARLTGLGFRVTAFDRPGLGYSGRATAAYDRAFTATAESPQEQAAILAAAAAEIGVQNPVVLGHSYGGSVAMAWGLDHPASAIVSVAGVAMPWPGELDTQYKVLGSSFGGAVVPPFITAFKNPMETGDILASIFAPQSAPQGYLPHVGPGLSLRRSTLRANSRQVNTLRPHMVTLASRYPDMTLPIEFVHGDADTIVPLQIHAAQASAILPDATLTVLDGIGHMPHHSSEDAVIDAISRAARRAGIEP